MSGTELDRRREDIGDLAGALRPAMVGTAVAGLDLVSVGVATIFVGADRVDAAALFWAGFAALV